jgi:hypothetical protein
MKSENMMKQMIDFQKTTLDAMITVTGRFQDQAKNSAQRMTDRAARWPHSGLKTYKEWLATTRQCIEDVKPVTNQWFQSWKHIIDAQDQPSPKARQKENSTS